MIRNLFLLSSIASIGDSFLTPKPAHVSNSISSSWQQSQQVLRHPTPLHADAAEEPSAEGDAPADKEHQLPTEEQADILNSPAFLKRKVEVLQSDIAALETEIEEANVVLQAGKDEWGNQFDMLNRESQGIQERLSKQGSQGRDTAIVDVANQILNVFDNYDRAFQAVEAATNEEVEIVEAYKNNQNLILGAFAELNVTKVETLGVEFDYENHQAVLQMPSDEYEEGLVCQEFAPGWRAGETLIKPAMVAVAL